MQPTIRGIARAWLQKRLFGTGPVDDWSAVNNFTGPKKDLKLLGRYAGVTYRCINTIAEAIAGEWNPYPYTMGQKGQKTTIANHPFIQLLENPNPDVSKYQLVEGMATFVEIFGEFFLYMVPGSLTGFGNGIKQVYLLRPDKMGIITDKNTGDVIGYKYDVGNGNTIPFTTEEVMHYMTFNPRNPYRGYSTVEAAIEYIDTETEVSKFTRNYFANNAALSGVLDVTTKMGRDQWNKFVRQFKERYMGTDNAGKVALVRDSQFKFTPLSSSLSDMQLTNLKQDTIEQLLMMFKVPKGMLGLESGEGLGRASVETLEYIFAKWTINPKMSRFDDLVQQILVKYYKTNQSICVDHENIIPSDKIFELQKFNQGVDRWITREEIRALDPELASNEVEGADQLFVGNNMLPINDAMSSDQAASKPPLMISPGNNPDDSTDPNDDDGGNDDPDDDDDSDTDKGIKKVILKSKKKELEPENFRSTLQSKANEYSHEYADAFKTVLAAQETTVLGNLGHLGKQIAWTKALSDNLFNTGDEKAAFKAKLIPVLRKMVKSQGQLALDFSQSDSEYQLSDSISQALDNSTDKMATNFDAATLAALNDTLTEGVQNGEGFDKLSKRVADVYQDASSWRTDRVARTESQNASNSATVDAYKQNPAVTAMEWFANPGACEYCDALAGTQVGLDDTFVAQGDSVDVNQDDGSTDSYQANYGDVDNPPLHPNCECTVIPVTVGS